MALTHDKLSLGTISSLEPHASASVPRTLFYGVWTQLERTTALVTCSIECVRAAVGIPNWQCPA